MALPQGSPDQCPLCGHSINPAPRPYGNLACSRCGVDLWFVWRGGGPVYYLENEAEVIRHRVKTIVAETLGIDPDKVPDDFGELARGLGSDSLDVVEVVMELEEDFDS